MLSYCLIKICIKSLTISFMNFDTMLECLSRHTNIYFSIN